MRMCSPIGAALLTFAVFLSSYAQSPSRGLRDKEIEGEIQTRLAKSVIGRENFKIFVRQGVAYWEGVTTVAQRKGAATRMAKAAGARAVVNNIVVRPASKTAPKSLPAKPHPASAEPASPPPAPRRVKVEWGPRPIKRSETVPE